MATTTTTTGTNPFDEGGGDEGGEEERPPAAPSALTVPVDMGHTWDDKRLWILHVPCQPNQTLGDLRHTIVSSTRSQEALERPTTIIRSWIDWTRGQLFEVRGCTLPNEVPISALALEPDECLRFNTVQSDCRAEGETMARSVQRLRDVRTARSDLQARTDKAMLFNAHIERTRSELAMSNATFDHIYQRVAENRERLSVAQAARLVLDLSPDYLSKQQAFGMIGAYSPNDDGVPGETYYNWGSFGDWMASFSLDPGPCAFYREFIVLQPPPDALGKRGYPVTYHGLDWKRTYTYHEARPIVAKYLIGSMGRVRNLPVGAEWGGSSAVPPEGWEIVQELDRRAQVRSEAMRGWGRLIKLAPIIGRWSLVLKLWYHEVSLRPGIGSVWNYALSSRFVWGRY